MAEIPRTKEVPIEDDFEVVVFPGDYYKIGDEYASTAITALEKIKKRLGLKADEIAPKKRGRKVKPALPASAAKEV